MRLKRLILFTVSAAVALGMLAGCGGGEDGADKAVVIEVDRWYPTSVRFPDPDDDIVLETIRKELNIDLRYDFSTGRSQEWRAKLAARAASGDLPDVIYFFNMMDYRTARSQGYIVPLNDVLNASNLPENLSYITEDMLRSISDDGGLYYGIPNRMGPMLEGMFIRSDWLRELGLEPPRTVEQFAAVAEAFAKRDPDGNGKDDTYGFTSGGCMSCQDFWELLSAFTGLASPDEYLADGELKGGWTSPRYREYLRFMRDLMAAGALDPDMAVNDSNRKTQKIVQGQVGIFHSTGYPADVIRQLRANDPGAEIAYLPPLEGPAGAGYHWPLVGVGTTIGITTKAAKSPEKVRKIVELVDWMNGEEGKRLLLYGAEGTNHVKERGEIRMLQGRQNDYLEVYNLIGDRSKFLSDLDVMKAFHSEPEEFETVKSMIEGGGKRGSVYGLGYAMERSELIDRLKSYREQMAARFIYGNASLDDAGWEAYVRAHDGEYGGGRVREAILLDLQKGGFLQTDKK